MHVVVHEATEQATKLPPGASRLPSSVLRHGWHGALQAAHSLAHLMALRRLPASLHCHTAHSAHRPLPAYLQQHLGAVLRRRHAHRDFALVRELERVPSQVVKDLGTRMNRAAAARKAIGCSCFTSNWTQCRVGVRSSRRLLVSSSAQAPIPPVANTRCDLLFQLTSRARRCRTMRTTHTLRPPGSGPSSPRGSSPVILPRAHHSARPTERT